MIGQITVAVVWVLMVAGGAWAGYYRGSALAGAVCTLVLGPFGLLGTILAPRDVFLPGPLYGRKPMR